MIDKNYICNYPKIINPNGCWIPPNIPNSTGYVQIMISGERLYLHRVAMCIFYEVEYNNYSIDTRHNKGCDRRCFNPDHVKPGTRSENIKDSVLHKTHKESRKTHCSSCGGPYTLVTNKHGAGKGISQRYCRYCSKLRQRKNYKKKVKVD